MTGYKAFTLAALLGENKKIGSRTVWRIHDKEGKIYFDYAGTDGDYYKLIKNGCEVHEVFDDKKPQRFHMDIDISANEDTCKIYAILDISPLKMADTIISVADDVIRELTGGISVDKYILGYANSKKVSRHVIYENIIASCGLENKQINQYILGRVQQVNPESEIWAIAAQLAIDPIGGTGSRSLRLNNCPKSGDDTKILFPINTYSNGGKIECAKLPKIIYNDVASPFYYHIGNPHGEPNIVWELVDEEFKGRKTASNSISNITEFSSEQQEELNELFAQMTKLYPEYNITTGQKGSIFGVKITRNKQSYCHVCCRNHSSLGAYVAVIDYSPRVCCFAAKNPSKKYVSSLNCIVRAHPKFVATPKLRNKYSAAPADSINSITEEHEIIADKNCHDGIEDDFSSSYIISAPWGAAKSAFIARAVTQAKEEGIKIIAISSRRSLSAQQAQAWGLVNYTEIKGRHNSDSHPYTNWQIDSLKRVDKNITGALIIVDEITALAHHCSGQTNYVQRAGLKILSHILKNSARYIVCDNDINNFAIDAMRIAAPAINPIIIRNNFNPFANINCNIFSGMGIHRIAQTEIFAELKENVQKFKDIGIMKSVCVAVHLREHVDTIVHQFNTEFPGMESYVCSYDANTGDDVKQTDFANATEAWKNKLLVVYSPTVTVGISCLEDSFENVYAIFEDGFISAQQSIQALFRCRKLKNINIFVESGGRRKKDKYPETEEELLKFINRGGMNDTVAPDVVGMTNYNDDMDIINDYDKLGYYLNNFVGKLYVSAMLQYYRSKNSFVGEMLTIFRASGINAVFAETVASSKAGDEVKQRAEKIKESTIAVSVAHFAEIRSAMENVSEENAHEKICKTRAEKMCLRGHVLTNYMKHFGIEAMEVADKYDSKIAKRLLFQQYREQDETTGEVYLGDIYSKIVGAEKERFDLIDRILFDYSYGLDVAYETNAAYIRANCHRLFDYQNVGRLKSDNKRGLLNIALKYVGLVIRNDINRNPVICNEWN
jgi:hypothetical protein